jgi:hypothetical protein
MTPRFLDPAVREELSAILVFDGLFTVVVVGVFFALDAMNVLDLREAMEAMTATIKTKDDLTRRLTHAAAHH